ncbi:putative dihydroneopterin aldolase [Corynebacterium heidelbergense]|uniref:7,8-dihydroneopterin aldolase n=1 Tax=Corynebacterium heidelbergense TaxID=2055947 RepID=A0A364VE84_9CORY|nr:dihydroneopterin aldolase [Corynebacterium heidelbergense]WCZ35873.1 putative dihydroneopterin aldolase [Corynebacterium heidelbergense]
MADRIELIGLEVYGYHGVYDEEKRCGQEFVVDIVVWRDFGAAAQADSIARTTSYVDLADIAVEVACGAGCDLIETVAARIADRISELPGLHAVEVTVHKPQAPIPYPFADVRVVARRSMQGRSAQDRRAQHDEQHRRASGTEQAPAGTGNTPGEGHDGSGDPRAGQ